ncbi:MAG: hypothetical protein KF873_02005 [Gemmataceae bacterium]|nr:hypothetical protein [Gemmataceae bacterium]
MSRIAAVVERAFRRQQETNGVAVAYTRDAGGVGEASAPLTVVPTDETTETNTPGTTIARHETNERSYLVGAADLVLGGSATVPTRGDRITEAGTVWEVLPRGSEPAWKYLDQTRTVYLVRTKRVS